ncbi:uncharacterized protein LOC132277966 [Cornus florida]|uniref:uncharacterized protein LOC132277966 n=1 Tax=Cornus florida TaxID=4283 RepID=UPI002899397F|nr:uncharacterized protein LOC132277966 [Cornus florida]
MDCYVLFGSMEILRKSFKILFQSGRLMSIIVSLTFLLYSLFYFANLFSIKPLSNDLAIKLISLYTTTPTSPNFINLLIGIKEDFGALLGVELAFVLAYSIVSLFSAVATILVSAETLCKNQNFSLHDLISRLRRSWTRPIVTSFYTTLLGVGYTYIFLAVLIPILMILYPSVPAKPIAIVLAIVALIFYAYLSVFWILGLVRTVMEESCYGIEALGKAATLIKGKRLQGFVLQFLFMLISVIEVQGLSMINVKQSQVNYTIIVLVMIFFGLLVKMFQFIAYTVLYFQCKKIHGEEIEVHGSIEYSKLPTTSSLVSEDIP